MRKLSLLIAITMALSTETAIAACIGNDNTCYGVDAMPLVTTGRENTAIGAKTLAFNETASGNTALGVWSLFNLKVGTGNVALGRAMQEVENAGLYNIGVGYLAGSVPQGEYNIGIGHEALRAKPLNGTSAKYNIAIGAYAGRGISSGSSNIALGQQTIMGPYNVDTGTTGNSNIAIGDFGLNTVSSGGSNIAVGGNALPVLTSGWKNLGIGGFALAKNVSGYRNVAVGDSAGSALTGSDNIIIGAGNTGGATDTGVIRIGKATFQKKAYIAGVRGVQAAGDAVPVLIDSTGKLGTVKSSRRYKTDIQSMGGASDQIMKLRPVTFRYIEDSQHLSYGLIAEEVAETFPDLAVYGDDGQPETVKYHELVPLLLNEIQKLNARVHELEVEKR